MAGLLRDLRFRVADLSDQQIVVTLLEELVDELGPAATAPTVKARLPEDIAAAMSSTDVCIFLAECGSETVGLGRADILTADPIFRLRDDRRCGYVDQMFVRPAYRARKVGSELLRLCEQWFRDQGIGHAILHAAPRAVRFYSREGYQPNREMFKKL